MRHWEVFNRRCARASLRGSIRQGRGIEAIWSHTALIVNNLTVPAVTRGGEQIRDSSELGACAKAAVADAEAALPAGLPWMFGVADGMLAEGRNWDAVATLADCGLHPMMGLTAMECEGPLHAPVRPTPAACITRRIPGPESQEAHDALDLNCAAYGMPLEITLDVIAARVYFADPAAEFGVVVYVEGMPASTATVVMLETGWAYVAAVATSAEHRKRGYAEAAMREALRLAGNPARTSLDASEMGAPLYAQMGYKPKYRWDFFAPPMPSH